MSEPGTTEGGAVISFIPYTDAENALGLAVNRDTFKKQKGNPFHVAYHEKDTTLIIDIETDQQLREVVSQVTEEVHLTTTPSLTDRLAAAHTIAGRVVNLQPYDTAGGSHNQQAETLGERLRKPTWCIDRALLGEAAMKKAGVCEHAYPLLSNWQLIEGGSDLHADLLLKLPEGDFVMITTREDAGKVIAFPEYQQRLNVPPPDVIKVTIMPDTTEYFEATK